MRLLRGCIVGTMLLASMICALAVALPDRYVRSLLIDATRLLTDRQLHIGTLELERSLVPRLTVEDVALTNAAWASRESLFSADSLSVTVSLLELLKGHLVIENLSTTGARLHLEIGSNGKRNWQLSSTRRASFRLSDLTIVSADAERTLVTLLDGQANRNRRLELTDWVLSSDTDGANPRIRANGTLDALPVTAALTVRTDHPGRVSAADVVRAPYELTMSAGDIEVIASGQLKDIGGARQHRSDVSVEMTSLARLGDALHRPLPDIGPASLTATLAFDPQSVATAGLDVRDMRIDVTDPRLRLEARGRLKNVPVSNTGSVSVALGVPDTSEALTLFGVDRPLPGELALDATVSGSNEAIDVDLQRAVFTSELVEAHFGGTVADVFGTAHAEVSVDLDAPDLSLITQLFGVGMPPEWGPLTASASLQGANGRYALNDIHASLDGDSKATAAGSIGSLMPFESMHLDVDVSLATLTEVSAFTSKPLPDLGPMIGTGVVGWRGGRLFLQGARVTHDSELGAATVTGNIGDLIRFDQVRLRADADLPNFSALELFTGGPLPDVDGVVASGNLISANARDLSARQLTVSATREGITVVGKGSVESFIKPDIEVDLALASSLKSLTQLNAVTGLQFPDMGPLQSTARLTGTRRKLTLADVDASLDGDTLNGTLNGRIDDVTRPDELAFDVTLRTVDVSSVADELGHDSPISAPASLSTEVRIDGNDLQLKGTEVDIGGSRIHGDLSLPGAFDDRQGRTVEGDVTLVNVDTTALFDGPVTAESAPSTQGDDGGRLELAREGDRILPRQALPTKLWLNDDIDIGVRIENFTSRLLDITDARLDLRAHDGVLTLGPFSGTVNDGQADLLVTVDASDVPSRVDVDLALGGFDLARAMIFEGTELIDSSGASWARLSLSGRGDSIADVLGSATGEGGIYIEDLLLEETALSVLSSDLIDQLTSALNPFAGRKIMGTQLLCSASLFQLQDGQLRTPFGFATEAGDFSILGQAEANFGDETLEIMFNPKPKTGLGLGLNRLASLVKLEGTLASPYLTLSETGLLQFGASLAAAVASGGVTLLAEGLYNRNTAMSEVCARALGH